FCGIRGETSTAVIKMWKAIEILEPIHKTMIFRTNQHTHVHFRKEFLGHELTPYLSAVVRGIVNKNPRDYPGGHVIFGIKSGKKSINCAAYEPTKRFRKIIRELVKGDEVKVFGGVRPESENFPLTINLEELRIIRLTRRKRRITPTCPSCGATLSSAGRNQGFKCKKCDFKTQKKEFIYTLKNRKIRAGIRYVIPVCAQRHLTKPISRDLPLQFHISLETDFQRSFYAFLEKRSQLRNRKFY
ncbi:MAG: TiaS agmantine-binding domain-containing protein, partial [Candidatus Hodarchaeales archaeon]